MSSISGHLCSSVFKTILSLHLLFVALFHGLKWYWYQRNRQPVSENNIWVICILLQSLDYVLKLACVQTTLVQSEQKASDSLLVALQNQCKNIPSGVMPWSDSWWYIYSDILIIDLMINFCELYLFVYLQKMHFRG